MNKTLISRASRSKSMTQQVYDTLHEKILTFHLKPYQALSEMSVSEMLGVSRTPAREALAMLAKDEFVDVVPQRGSQVAPLRLENLYRSQFMREALETALLRRAMAMDDTAPLVLGLRKQITLQKTYAGFGDAAAVYASDEVFHGLICEFAQLPSVLPEILRVKGHMNRFRHLMVSGIDDLDTVIEQHSRLVDAIEAKDIALTETRMVTHLRRIFDYIENARLKYPDYFESTEP